ncbi:response regulator [Myxococcota bacterium]|nr:response regulator [Myxococcota bacterium]
MHFGLKKMPAWFSRRSIHHKMVILTVAISLAAVLFAGAIMLAATGYNARATLVNAMVVQAEILADSSRATLSFDDSEEAQLLLQAEKAIHNIEIASIHRLDGSVLASYTREHTLSSIPSKLSDSHVSFVDDKLQIVQPVFLDGKVIGHVFLCSTLQPVYSQLRFSLISLLIAVVLALAVAFGLTYLLQYSVTRPIVILAEMAARVKNEQDYSLRAQKLSDDEVGLLTDTLNQMLQEIGDNHRALTQSEQNYRAIFNGIQESIFIHNADDGSIVDVNHSVLRMFDYEYEELLGLDIEALSAPQPQYAQESVVAYVQRALDEGPQIFPWRSKRRDGTLFWSEVALVSAEFGGEQRVVAVLRDMTQRKELEEQLLQAQKMEALGTLAGGIAHDFNNILQAIVSSNQMAMLNSSPSDSSYRYLEAIQKAGRRAVGLVKQILTLSRHEVTEDETIQLEPLVEDALKMLRATIPSTIEFDVHQLAPESWVRGDATRVHQVLMNLCTNAYHAMRESGGKLTVIIEEILLTEREQDPENSIEPGPYARIQIQDTGKGISAEHRQKIFDPFFTTKEKGEGTGLGLAVARGIVDDMGGAIRLESTVGQGTTFEVLLPAFHVKPETVREQLMPSLPSGNEHILVVDDEPIVAEIYSAMLKELGYIAHTIIGSVQAWEHLKQDIQKYDAIITDMTMPKMTGLELGYEIHALRPDLPILLTTGFSETLSQEGINRSGISDVLLKPFSLEDLAKTVRKILDESPDSKAR